MKERLTQLIQNIPPEIDAALIQSGVNRQYYTGFLSSAGTVLAFRDKQYLIIDSRYFEAASEAVSCCEVLLQKKLPEQINHLLEQHGAKRIAMEGSTSMAEYLRLKEMLHADLVLDNVLSDAIQVQRRIKSPQELESISAAQRIADETFAFTLEIIEAGMTEKELALEMEFYSRKEGSEEVAFSFIVASGANSSRPHAVPSDKLLQNGDFITMDFGATVNGYRSDMTRTVALGSVSEKQREVYNLVLKMQLDSLAAVKPGACCKDVDHIARQLSEASPYKGLFGHGLGHSVGLEIHEDPRFNTECVTILEPGMIMTVEPGIYIPGEFGVRIEDMVYITTEGYENLCTSGKELIVL